MAKKPAITSPPVALNGRRDENLFTRVNPLTIIVGMGFASLFAWFLTGGGGNGNDRRPTHMPEFGLGEEVGGQTITGIRTRWEYEMDDESGWLQEESL